MATFTAPQPEFSRSDPWVKEIDRRGATLVGSAEWGQFRASADLGLCRLLADTAAALNQLKSVTHRALQQLVDRTLASARPVVRRVVLAVLKRLVDDQLGGVPTLARAIRALGVFVCVLNGRPLTSCACFTAWWKAEGSRLTKVELWEALPRPRGLD
jgi:hypothetical protein